MPSSPLPSPHPVSILLFKFHGPVASSSYKIHIEFAMNFYKKDEFVEVTQVLYVMFSGYRYFRTR